MRLGDIDLERDDEPSSPETYAVKAVHAHTKFSRVGFYNDIAVLELAKPVRKSPYVIPICLPHGRYRSELFQGARPTVVGWGTTYYGGLIFDIHFYYIFSLFSFFILISPGCLSLYPIKLFV